MAVWKKKKRKQWTFGEKRDQDWRPAGLRLASYLTSFQWWQTRDRYRKSGLPVVCLLCGKRQYQLHHTDYRNLGSESVASLRPLCGDHHRELHQFLNRHAMTLDKTDEALRTMSHACADTAAFEQRMSMYPVFLAFQEARSKEGSPHSRVRDKAFEKRRQLDPQGVIDDLLKRIRKQTAEYRELEMKCHEINIELDDIRLENAAKESRQAHPSHSCG